MFGGIYACEILFSTMKLTKTKLGAQPTDEHLQDGMLLSSLKSAQLSLDTLNQDALTNSIAMSPSTQLPYTFDRDTYTTYTTRTGRSVRRPIHLTDYTP